MKTIKDLTVKVTYKASNVEVREEVYEVLNALANYDLINDDEQIRTAFEWFADHIHEGDAFNWDYEVDIE